MATDVSQDRHEEIDDSPVTVVQLRATATARRRFWENLSCALVGEGFDAGRTPDQYIHFGHGLHQCFGTWINQATLHLMLKPLLKRPNLRRASGRDARLRKHGAFASTLIVAFD